MITLEEAFDAARKLGGGEMDPAKTVETDWCWAFEPRDIPTLYGKERRRASPAVVMKADGHVKVYARYLRARDCVRLAEQERRARRDARNTNSYPTVC